MIPIRRALPCSLALAMVLFLLLAPALAQRPEPKVFAVVDGAEIYTVLPPDTIPAIHEPHFVQGAEAEAQMSPGEHVMGLLIGGEARAYSTWQLDHHEIVNDSAGGIDFAVTW